ncbi:hypothetical protein RFI_13510 [Reticulomyxa filosa]|uniref:Uncharacterized protein n=1 Tax=Reticulomyxa filosa TaxID=46433 RepID=X6NCQ1_RETFI|nr:hypothetical protein RFI_13510 [Reticulomyxa filosa]|eukprot:ETO23673.1 hypothetical protein RFI_13510 [Reticulomyxa filosa]
MNRNDIEHSSDIIQEEFSQSESRFDEDAPGDASHQLGRFLVEKVNSQELVNDVKSHAIANTTSAHTQTQPLSLNPHSHSNTNASANVHANSNANVNANTNASINAHANANTNNANANINANANVNTNVNTNASANTTAIPNNAIVSGASAPVATGTPTANTVTTIVIAESFSGTEHRSITTPTAHENTFHFTVSQTPLTNASAPSVTIPPLPIAEWTKQDCIRWVSSLGDAFIAYATAFDKNGHFSFFFFCCQFLLLSLHTTKHIYVHMY